MLIFGRNFAVEAWSRFWGWNLIKICIRTTQPSGPWCFSLLQCFKILNGSNDEKDHRAPRSVWAQHFEDDETTNDYRGRFPRQTARFQPQTRTTRPDLEMLMVILIRMKIRFYFLNVKVTNISLPLSLSTPMLFAQIPINKVMREIEKSILETIDKGEAVPLLEVRVTQGTNLS